MTWLALIKPLMALLAILGAGLAGWRLARQRGKIEGLTGYKETRERIDNAPLATNPADARKWLRDRKP